jgi:sirohydrochlorin ferrochelatase
MTRQSLILFSHGSLLCGAGRTLARHADALREAESFASVSVGYLNYMKPSFEDAVQDALRHEPDEIFIQPWFLVAGKFVREDLPPRIEAARALAPQRPIRVGPVFGRALELAGAWLECAKHHRPVSHWAAYLDAAPSFCERRADCPLYGIHPCPVADGPTANRPETPAEPPADKPWLRPALLIMAHGSPRQETCDEIEAIAEPLRAANDFAEILVSYLDCNSPTIGNACDILAAWGHRQIIALPHFLHTGRHVCDDVPTILEEAMARHPGLTIHMTPFVGQSPRLVELAQKNATSADPVG